MSRFPWFILTFLLLPSQPLGAQSPEQHDTSSPAFGEPALREATSVDRFWIVSSRGCPQSLSEMRNCRLDVWAVDESAFSSAFADGQQPLQARRCELNEAVFQQALIPGVPVCVFVHGSYIEPDRVKSYSRGTYRWLRQAHPDQPLHFIFFTWPSDPITYVPQVDFNELSDRAGLNGFYLARVVHHVPVECPISLIGHSQGASTVVSTMHLLGGGAVQGYRLPPEADRGHRVRLVLAAAAIDHQWLNPGDRYGNSLPRTEAVLNLINRRDWALGFYHLRAFGSGRAVSRAGFQAEDFERMGLLAQKIDQRDITTTVGRDHTWPSYYSIPSLAHSISDYVYFSETQMSRPIKVLTPPDTNQTRFAGGGETLQRAVSK